MIAGNLHADTEQLYLDSGVIKVADFGEGGRPGRATGAGPAGEEFDPEGEGGWGSTGT